MGDSVFDNDRASLFAEQKTPPPPTSWSGYDHEVERQIAAGPDQTVAGFAWNFGNVYERNLVSMIESGKFAEAKAYERSISESIDANGQNLLDLTRPMDVAMAQGRRADGPSSNTIELANRAFRTLKRDYLKSKVTLPDGTETTINDVIADGSPYLATKTSDLEKMNFAGNAIGLYTQGDVDQRRIMQSIMDPVVQPRGPAGAKGRVQNQWQLVNFANDVANNWDRLSETFGDGLGTFLDYVRTSHNKSGNASETMRTLTELAESMNTDGRLDGRTLATQVVNGYNDALTAAFRGDPMKDSEGRISHPEITDAQRRSFDAVVLPAIKSALETGVKFDFRDPRVRGSLKKVTDTMAYVSASGADMFSDARTEGYDLNGDFGKYVVSSLTGARPSSGNIVETVDRLRASLDRYIVGADDVVPVTAEPTGHSKDYARSVDRMNGSKSSNSEADGMALSAKQYLFRSLLPFMAGGHRLDDAISYLMSDDGRRDEFVNGLAEQFLPSFHGEGADRAAKVLAANVLDGFMSGRSVSIESAIKMMTIDPSMAGLLSDSGLKAANAWYHGNVTNRAITADHRMMLMEHLRAVGMSDHQARRVASNVAMQSSIAQAHGSDPIAPYREALSIGKMFIPDYDANGNIINVRTVIGKMNNAKIDVYLGGKKPVSIQPGTYESDPALWELVQNRLAAEDKRLRQEREAAKKTAEKVDMMKLKQQMTQENAEFRNRLRNGDGVDL